MAEIDNISFKLNSTFDGNGNYIIYNSPSCEGDLVLSGSTNITNGTSIVNINQSLNLNQNISIYFEDSKGCEVCNDYEISIPQCEPFTGTAVYVEDDPTIFVTAIILQTPGTDCTNGNSSDSFSTIAYIRADYDDLVMGNGGLVLDNTSGLSFGGIETELYNPNDENVEISEDSLSFNMSNFITGETSETFLINQVSLLDSDGPDIVSSTNGLGTILFQLCD